MHYAYLDKNIKAVNIVKFIWKRENWKFVNLSETPYLFSDATSVAVHGVLRGNSEVIQQAIQKKIPWIYMDNASDYFPGMYKRVSINETVPQFMKEGQRFDHKIELKPWRGGSGDKILLLPPSPPYMDTFGTRNWLNEMVHSINLYTGREVVVRAKPAKDRFSVSLQHQLNEAYCVVTWGSAVALEAMRQGIPTISTGWCPAKHASKRFEDLETLAMVDEPPRKEIFDSLTWSCFTKKELKKNAYNQLMENYKLNF